MDRAILHEIDTINGYLKRSKDLNTMTIKVLLNERSLLFDKLDN